jgi:hypothetical protein
MYVLFLKQYIHTRGHLADLQRAVQDHLAAAAGAVHLAKTTNQQQKHKNGNNSINK